MTLSYDTFEETAARCNVIPVVREILADCETPISIAAKLDNQETYFLLESVDGGENWGRYSLLGFNITKELVIDSDRAFLVENGHKTELPGNPVDALHEYVRAFTVAEVPGLPRFFGGLVGYLAFETVRYFERCGERRHDNPTGFPDAHFLITDHMAIFDNIHKTVMLCCCVHPGEHRNTRSAYQHGLDTLDQLESIILAPRPKAQRGEPSNLMAAGMTSNLTRTDYEDIVERGRAYIRDGDIIQVVLAQHFSRPISAAPLDVYRALRLVNPSPYLYYLKLDSRRAIAGSSPEVLVRVTADKAEIRPIAGTRPRGKSPEEDERLGAELLADKKERAEHVMLVDLARNDLGRVAETGSVTVAEYMFIEKYSHVMHLVSHVEARLREDVDAVDVLKASFPAGTLSGAPKVRAMEIINELEPIRRGPYGGALGYIAYGAGIMDMAITIRTVVMENGTATVTAGAGVVYDSVPEKEYEETVHKSNGMLKALELAENRLRLD